MYSGYADDTTLFLADLEDLSVALSIFKDYSRVSGMKLNMTKCSIIPFGTSIDIAAPTNGPFKWLNENSEMEKLLGVPIGVKFNNDLIWQKLLLKLSDSIKHWTSQ